MPLIDSADINTKIKTSVERDIIVRWMVILISVPLVYLYVQVTKQADIVPVMSVIAAAAFLNVAYTFLLDKASNVKLFYIASTAIDILIVTFGLYFTGGMKSPLYLIYLLVIVDGCFDVGIKGIFYYLFGFTALSYTGLYLIASAGTPLSAELYLLCVRLVFIGIIGYISYAVAKKITAERDKTVNESSEIQRVYEALARSQNVLEHEKKTATDELNKSNMRLLTWKIRLLGAHEIYKLVGRAKDAAEFMEIIIDQTVGFMRGSGGLIFFFDKEKNVITIESYRNPGLKSYFENNKTIGAGTYSDLDKIVLGNEPGFLNRINRDDNPFFSFFAENGSCIYTPIIMRGETRGFLVIFSVLPDVAYGKDDIEFVNIFGDHTGALLHNGVLMEQAKDKAAGLEKLSRVAEEISKLLDVDEIMATAVTQCSKRLFPGSAGFVMTPDEKGVLRITSEFGHKTDVLGLEIPESSMSGFVFRNNRQMLIKDIASMTHYDIEFESKYLYGGAILTPISSKGRAVGVIGITGAKKECSRDDMHLLTLLSNHLASSIEIAGLYENLKRDYENAIYALAAAVDAKDSYTHGHSNTVMKYATELAKFMGLSEQEIEDIKYAALLHDVGKIGISENIINKPGKLTKEEYDIIKLHPRLGADIVLKIESLEKLVPFILGHHEWMNGSGYPLGLRGEEIPFGARILSICDAYSTMTAKRPYREPMLVEDAVKELARSAGTQFDEKLVKQFVAMIKETELPGEAELWEKMKKEAKENKPKKKKIRIKPESALDSTEINPKDGKFYS